MMLVSLNRVSLDQVERSAPLSLAQERLWLLHRLDPGDAAYNLTRAFRLAGTLEAAALERALEALAWRHSILRTRFAERDGVPVQLVLSRPTVRLEWEVGDLDEAGLAGRVRPVDFRYGESACVPPEVSLPNRNYMNLLELPVLFYVAGLIAFVTGQVSPLQSALAWGYVGLRVAHSLIHLSYNNVYHRLAVFALSNFVLLALWVALFMGLGR